MDGERPLLLEEAAPRALRARRYAWLGEAAVSALRAAALIAVGVLLGARGLHRADSRDEPAAGARKVRSSSPQHELLGHDKDCASVNFTQETLMLISEGPIMRCAARARARRSRRRARAVATSRERRAPPRARARARADFQMTARGELATGDVLKAYEASDVTRRDTRFAGMGERPVLGAEHETFVVFDNARSIGRFSSLLDSERDFPPVMLQCARAHACARARALDRAPPPAPQCMQTRAHAGTRTTTVRRLSSKGWRTTRRRTSSMRCRSRQRTRTA